MLVLTRRTEESILIGDDIEIKVLQVRGSGEQAAVRIGVVAPRSIAVVRKEVRDAVAAENRRASTQRAATDLEALLSKAVQRAPGRREFQKLGGSSVGQGGGAKGSPA